MLAAINRSACGSRPQSTAQNASSFVRQCLYSSKKFLSAIRQNAKNWLHTAYQNHFLKCCEKARQSCSAGTTAYVNWRDFASIRGVLNCTKFQGSKFDSEPSSGQNQGMVKRGKVINGVLVPGRFNALGDFIPELYQRGADNLLVMVRSEQLKPSPRRDSCIQRARRVGNLCERKTELKGTISMKNQKLDMLRELARLAQGKKTRADVVTIAAFAVDRIRELAARWTKEHFLEQWMIERKRAGRWTKADERLMARNGCGHLVASR